MIPNRQIILFICILLLSISSYSWAETELARTTNPHEIRIGWGDQLMEQLAFHDQIVSQDITTDYHLITKRTSNYRYAQHWFVEYHYRQNGWFSYGGMVDASGMTWKETLGEFNYLSDNPTLVKSTAIDRNAWNIVVMPTIRFTYLLHEYVSLFSGIGLGIDIAGGSETDYRGRTTALGAAIQLTPIGIKASYSRWFATTELGLLAAFENGQVVYLPGARLISVSLGVTF